MMPCVLQKGCGLFTATADQRYLSGDVSFMRTHFPANMKRFMANGKIENWQEEDLKKELIQPEKTIHGNRTIVLYGAAGSGKSEVIRWLWHEMKKTDRSPFVLRISRTELDPVQIIHKLLTHFRLPGLDAEVLSQWSDLRKKPVTLANHLVWSALGTILPSDEEIIPLSYKLRPIVEKNLENSLCGTEGTDWERGIELISLEELEELAQQCYIPEDIDLEQVRFQMLRELEHSVMGGLNFVESLRMISAQVKRISGQRPMLLVDDLVQSLNIYATDLLDYFVTMEEGNWDIILGLTPASFESSKRGRQLLNRINHLDTFDDRILKLWMSDEQGNDSFVVNEENCHLFAAKYLDEYKRINGFECGPACSFHNQCTDFKSFIMTPDLLPFNGPLLRRIYRSLPRGKGKPRYFIREIGQILKKMAGNDLMGALEHSFIREFAVDHQDLSACLIIESYINDEIKTGGSFSLDTRDLKKIYSGIDLESEVIRVELTSIMSYKNQINEQVGKSSVIEIDPGKMAIRDWLNASDINKELLKGLRQGIAHFLRDAVKPTDIMPPFTARQSSVIKWEETQGGSKIPLVIEGIDGFEGINVLRAIGHSAYHFNYLYLRRGRAKETAVDMIMNNDHSYDLMLETKKYNDRIREGLETELGMPVDEFAYHLFRILLELRQNVSEIPPVLCDENNLKNKFYPQKISHMQVFFRQEEADTACALFKDWFLLRENIYDGLRLKILGQRSKKADSIEIIEGIDGSRINEHYQVGGIPLGRYILNLQTNLKNMKKALCSDETRDVITTFININSLLSEMQYPVVHTDIASVLAYISANLHMEEVIVPDWQACNKLKTRIYKSLKGYMANDSVAELKSPLKTHRFLLILGTLENDPDYRKMLAVNEFISNAQQTIELQYLRFRHQVDQIGVGGYFGYLNDITDRRNQIDHCQLEEMAVAVKDLINDRHRLTSLEISLPYINHSLADHALLTAEKLQPLLEYDLPEWFLKNIKAIILSCTSYANAISNLMDKDIGPGAVRYPVHQLASNYNKLANNGLQALLHALREDWHSYILRRNQIMSIIQTEKGIPGMKEDPGNVPGHEEHPAPVIAEQLITFIADTLVIPQALNEDFLLALNEKASRYLPLINLLMQNTPPEIEVDPEFLAALNLLLNDFGGFKQELRARIYLKQQKQ